MSRHDALRATWEHGQYFETRLDECAEGVWVPVGNHGRSEPLWDPHQEYRRREDLETKDCDDREAMAIWVQAGMPPYMLSKPGTNHGLLRFLKLARERGTAEPSGETMGQREEVCAAWEALPDDLRKDPRLTRLYHALGGPRMDDPSEADRVKDGGDGR